MFPNEIFADFVFKPSNHDYPYVRLLHPHQLRAWLASERQKVAVAAGLTVALVLFFALLIACKCRQGKSGKINGGGAKSGRHLIWASGLTELEDKGENQLGIFSRF